jgi:shikimate kinase
VKEGQRKQKEDDACASTSGVLLTSNSDDSISKYRMNLVKMILLIIAAKAKNPREVSE